MSIRVSDGKQQAMDHIVEHNLPAPSDEVSFLVFTDASIDKSEWVVGLGWVICRCDGTIICEGSRRVEPESEITIQEGEVMAMKYAVQQVRAMDWLDAGVTVFCDNNSVVEAFERETAVHEIDAFQDVRANLSSDSVQWIRRDYNVVADEICKNARKEPCVGIVEQNMAGQL